MCVRHYETQDTITSEIAESSCEDKSEGGDSSDMGDSEGREGAPVPSEAAAVVAEKLKSIMFEAPRSKVPGQWVRDGSLLQRVLRVFCGRYLRNEAVHESFLASVDEFPSELTYVSFCTDSGMDSDAMDALQTLFQSCGIPATFKILSSCEIEGWKCEWLKVKHSQEAEGAPCLFPDIRFCTGEDAPCLVHGWRPQFEGKKKQKPAEYARCRVPRGNIAFC